MQVEQHARPVIVVGVDGSESSTAALVWAIDEAERRGASVEAVCAWVYAIGAPPYLVGGGSVHDYLVREAEETVNAAVTAARSERPGSTVTITSETMPGPPALALLRRSHDAELLVVGSRGRGGFSSLLLGSVSQQVTMHATCPVVVVRASRPAPLETTDSTAAREPVG
jgi:nucleotide-binding universal stress UspA family protein